MPQQFLATQISGTVRGKGWTWYQFPMLLMDHHVKCFNGRLHVWRMAQRYCNRLNNWNMLFRKCKMYLKSVRRVWLWWQQSDTNNAPTHPVLSCITVLLKGHAKLKGPNYWLMKVGAKGKEEVVEKLRKRRAEAKLRWGGKSGLDMEVWMGRVGELGVSWDWRCRSTYREGNFILRQREKWPVLLSPVSFIQLS